MAVSKDVSMTIGLYGQQTFYHEDNIAKHVRSQLFRVITSHMLHSSAGLNSRFLKRNIRAAFHFQTLALL